MFDLLRTLEKKKKIDPKEVINILQYEDEDFAPYLKDCDNLGDVFNDASEYWSFFNYDLVELLSNRFGSVANGWVMKKYTMKFKEYSKRRLRDVPMDSFGYDYEKKKDYILKTNKNMKVLTVDNLRTLQMEINEVLHKRLLCIVGVDDEIITLTIRSFAQDITKITIRQRVELRKLGILSIRYGDQFIDTGEAELFENQMKMICNS